MCMLNALAHQSSMQELDLLNPQLDPRISYTGGPKMFFGADGLLRDSPTNLALWSQDFDNAAWTKTRASVVANAAAAPDGTVTADKLVENTAVDSHYCSQAVSAALVPDNATANMGVHAKAGERTWLKLTTRNKAGAFLTTWFNLATGAVGTDGHGTAKIEAKGNGWYRCTVDRGMGVGATSPTIFPEIAAGDGITTHAGDGASGIYLWGAQIDKYSGASQYLPTTSAIVYGWPLEYDPITLQPLGRSVWEQRTNLETNSETLTGYTRSNSTAPSTASLLGMPAFLLTETTATGLHFLSSPTVSFTAGTTYTMSRYVKSAGRNASLGFPAGPFGASIRWTYDLVTGTATRNVGGTNDVGTITPLGGGVYRITLSAQATATAAGQGGMYTVAGSTLSYTGDGVSGVIIAGHQMEAGAFASPYIPTAGSQVTRVADVVTASLGVVRFNAEAGTLVAELQFAPGSLPASNFGIIAIGGNSASNYYHGFYASVIPRGIKNGSVVNMAALGFDTNAMKLAYAYSATGRMAMKNGGTPATDVGDSRIPLATDIQIGGNVLFGAATRGHTLRRVRLYPASLVASEQQALTA